MTSDVRRIADNLARVQVTIAQSAESSGRTAADINLVVVTKYVGVEHVEALIEAGGRDLGESRPQELWRKVDAFASSDFDPPLRWHQVGHLQRNKVARTLPLVSLIHSVDSLRLLDTMENVAAQLSRPTPFLLEVNVSGEPAKHGCGPEEIEPILPKLVAYPHLRLRGLMTMASLIGGRERAREDFTRLRQLRDRLAPACPPGASLDELSMGMSRDYDLAIAEGATIVRVGSSLFEGIRH